MPVLIYFRNIFLIFIVLGSFSCKYQNQDNTINDLKVPESIRAKFNTSSLRRYNIDMLVTQISAYPSVDGPAVSIDGRKTAQYGRSLSLRDLATEEELIQLTQHQSGNVKAYAFQALCDRNSSACKMIFEMHINDNTPFTQFSGCLRTTNYINVYYLQLISVKIGDNELEFYKNKILANFDPIERNWINRFYFF